MALLLLALDSASKREHDLATKGLPLSLPSRLGLLTSLFVSMDYEGPPPASTAGNVDFGIGFEGSSSENLVEENDMAGNTNGVLFFNTSSDNVVRRNIIVGNPSAQVIKTFVASNQGGADIAFRASFTGANNVLRDNFCLTYLRGGGPATAPCPNFRTSAAGQ